MTAAPMVRGPRLTRGDRVALVAPSSPFEGDVVDAGRAELARLGYEPVHDESIFARRGFVAGTSGERAETFTRIWLDPGVKALLAVRGGYGSAQMLPLLDAAILRRVPKLFIGYSDTTSLAAWLSCHAGITAVHGPMLEGRLAKGPMAYDERSFVRLLSGEAGFTLAPPGLEVVRGGTAEGPLYGGTLTQLAASLGTPYAFEPPDGCVLFLEDANERPYRLDRLLTQLSQAGTLGRARAIVFGEMRGCDEPGGGPTAREVIADFAATVDGPVLVRFPSGHTTGPCWSLPLGTCVRVTTAPAGVVVEKPVVV